MSPRSLPALLAMVLILGACGAAPATTTTPPDPTTTTTTATGGGGTSTTLPDAASQSPADAARDGVLPALAALPFDARVEVVASVETDEGTWTLSRPGPGAEAHATDCRLGAEYGEYPVDFICTTEYGEVLLIVDGAIARAYPLPGIPPEYIEVTPEAVFCGRNGEGMLPDSVVCRIDRSTLASLIRVFPGEVDSVVVQPCFYPPAAWELADHHLTVTGLDIDSRGLWVEGVDGPTVLDPVTLLPVGQAAKTSSGPAC